MTINENELFDYIKCPCYYELKYIKKIRAEKNVSMSDLLDQIVRYYYTSLLQNKPYSMNDLKKKWDYICKKYSTIINQERNIKGIGFIVNFVRWMNENNIKLVDFNSTYSITFKDVEVIGTLGAVIAQPKRKCELIITRFSQKKPDQNMLDKKLKYTLDCYAFKEAYEHDINMIRIINFKNNLEYITQRTQTDFDRLEKTIIGVANGIKSKAFYPREESMYCSSCEMKQFCKFWC